MCIWVQYTHTMHDICYRATEASKVTLNPTCVHIMEASCEFMQPTCMHPTVRAGHDTRTQAIFPNPGPAELCWPDRLDGHLATLTACPDPAVSRVPRSVYDLTPLCRCKQPPWRVLGAPLLSHSLSLSVSTRRPPSHHTYTAQSDYQWRPSACALDLALFVVLCTLLYLGHTWLYLKYAQLHNISEGVRQDSPALLQVPAQSRQWSRDWYVFGQGPGRRRPDTRRCPSVSSESESRADARGRAKAGTQHTIFLDP